MSRPVVGISASAHLIEETYRVQGAGERTLEAVAAVADALPIMLPGLPDAAATGELVELLDGLVLTGARANVHPQSYGEAETAGHGPFDRGRDGVTLPLIRAMVEAGKPVFGICRGIQEMNVAYGGTLHPEIRDLPGRLNHRMPRGETDHGVIFAKRHVVRFSEGGWFHRLLGVTETVTNSLHGQAVWTTGGRVRVEGHAEDGTVEAIAIDGARAFALGVQWHAEYDAGADPVSRALFAAFGADARAVRAARGGRRGAA